MTRIIRRHTQVSIYLDIVVCRVLTFNLELLDGILDYPSYFPLLEAFTSPQGRFSNAVTALKRAQASYKHGLFRTGSFIENHDQRRLASVTQDRAVCDFCPGCSWASTD